MADTWATILAEIEDENDLAEETFVDAGEMMAYANSALEDIEKEIHTLHDRYFAAEANLSLVTNTAAYSLPADIYATKITGIFYNDGSNKYELKEIKDLSVLPFIQSSDRYQYRVVNNASTGLQIKLYPASRETNATFTTIFYRRKVAKFVLTTTVIDVPEGKEFVKQFVSDKVANKERMTPDAPESGALTRKRKQLLDSLENQIDDDNNQVVVDTSFYEEFI